MNKFKIVILIFLSFNTLFIFACDADIIESENFLDMHPQDYMSSKEYVDTKEVIREELVRKLPQMVATDNYDHILHYLFFITDISDERYIGLLEKIEKKHPSHAGINIVGFSSFVRMKNNKVNPDQMIKELVSSEMGPYLFDTVLGYVLINTKDFHEKLQRFFSMCIMVDYEYRYIINETVKTLCEEDREIMTSFLKDNQKLKNNLHYDCSDINLAP